MPANPVSEQSEGGYPKPESAKGFKGPVRWLLGPQVIASLIEYPLHTPDGDV